MTKRTFVILIALLASGCSFAAPTAPESAPTPTSASEPYAINLGASSAAPGVLVVTARVLNARAQPLAGASVQFVVAGVTDRVSTSIDGVATLNTTGSGVVSIIATCGSLRANTLVVVK